MKSLFVLTIALVSIKEQDLVGGIGVMAGL